MSFKSKVTNQQIYNLIMQIASSLPSNFVWSGSLKSRFNKITKHLKG